MRILFCSHAFAPSVGGIETVSRMLAEEFVQQGHQVRLVTGTPGKGDSSAPYSIHRNPSAGELLRLFRWSEVCFHNNISLRTAWPLLLARRPWVVAHHVWIPRSGAAGRLKRLLIGRAAGIAASRALADHLETPSTVIPNPYEDDVFRIRAGVGRDRQIIFVGRLVSDKGCDQLLDAVRLLGDRDLRPSVTIVGSGPERPALEARATQLGIADRVTFTGPLHGEALVEMLNRHVIVAVPSRWEEPFGLVALEGIACGCIAVASDGGGLPEAIGPCGLTYRRGDASALANALERVLQDEVLRSHLRAGSTSHLATHQRRAVARRYLEVLVRSLAGIRHG